MRSNSIVLTLAMGLLACLLLVAGSGGAVSLRQEDLTPQAHLPIIRRDPTPTYTPTPIPTPTPTPTVAPEVIVLSSSAFVPYSGSSSLYIVGEVLNITGSNVDFVEINATLRNASGNVVGSDYTYSMIDILTPGMTSPFRVSFWDVQPWASYELVVTWDTTSGQPYPLEVLNSMAYFDSFDGYHVVGEARNQYNEQRTFVKAFVTLYDATGTVIGADYDYTNPDELNPGQTASFDAEVSYWKGRPDRAQVASHRLQVVDD